MTGSLDDHDLPGAVEPADGPDDDDPDDELAAEALEDEVPEEEVPGDEVVVRRRPTKKRRLASGAFMGAASIFAGTTNADEHWAINPHDRITMVVDQEAEAEAAAAKARVRVAPPEGGLIDTPLRAGRRRHGRVRALFRRRRPARPSR